MKYNAGDTVTILPEFLLKEYYEWIKKADEAYTANVVPGMYRYGGSIATITYASSRYHSHESDMYRLDVDGGKYAWEDIMFERIEPMFNGDPVPTWVLLNESMSEDIDSLLAAGERSEL